MEALTKREPIEPRICGRCGFRTEKPRSHKLLDCIALLRERNAFIDMMVEAQREEIDRLHRRIRSLEDNLPPAS